MTKSGKLTPYHLGWVIDGRAKNQKAALKLYEMMGGNLKQIREKKLSTEVQDLIAVSFSLWRAVFLADRTREIAAKMSGAQVFLAKMLTDNAIAFAQDREAREWTFNYYLDNAFFRLEKYCDRNILRPALPARRTPRNRWDCLQAALEKEIHRLEKSLESPRKNSN